LLSLRAARAFDSGLGEAERFSFADSVRPRTQEKRDARGPQGSRRVYLEPLKTTLGSTDAEAILSRAELRSHVTCNLGCCRLRGFDGLAGRARQHYLWVKTGEVANLASALTPAMRIEHVHRCFREARDLSTVVTPVLGDHKRPAPHFEHLDRWLAVLSRSTTALHEAA
jgi:hypothetical protein